MKINKLILILIISVISCFVSACHEDNKEEKDFLISAISNQRLDLTPYKYIVIVPGIGCHGCIQESEYFLKQNINNQDILFIISNPQSLKILQNKIKVKLNDYENVIIDRKSTYQVPTNNSIYPCVLYLDNHKHSIKSIDFQSPKNGALNKLTKIL